MFILEPEPLSTFETPHLLNLKKQYQEKDIHYYPLWLEKENARPIWERDTTKIRRYQNGIKRANEIIAEIDQIVKNRRIALESEIAALWDRKHAIQTVITNYNPERNEIFRLLEEKKRELATYPQD